MTLIELLESLDEITLAEDVEESTDCVFGQADRQEQIHGGARDGAVIARVRWDRISSISVIRDPNTDKPMILFEK